ncbi:MAG: hypothetical protein J7L69_07180 [Desulfobulbaceae bacterium]|nr:hypothetical protein [Desulfobulbaceae bacterium]
MAHAKAQRRKNKKEERRQETGGRGMRQKVGKFEDLEVWKEGMRLAT